MNSSIGGEMHTWRGVDLPPLRAVVYVKLWMLAVWAGLKSGWQSPTSWYGTVRYGLYGSWEDREFQSAARLTRGLSRLLRRVWVNAYHVQKRYGGPEEGGWWYDEGIPLSSVRLWPWDRPHAVAAWLVKAWQHEHDPQPLSNVNSRGQVWVEFEEQPAQQFPRERPRYE